MEESGEIFLVSEWVINKKIASDELLERLKAFTQIHPAVEFDFVIFDGVRQILQDCQKILGFINTHFDKMNIHITSLEFDIKGGDGSAGTDGPNEFLQMDSWTYEDYKAPTGTGISYPNNNGCPFSVRWQK